MVTDLSERVHPCCDSGSPPTGNAAPNLRASAKWYASAMNWRVFPLWGVDGNTCECERGAYCPQPGMHSRIPDWGVSASANERVVDEWWQRWPNSNVAALNLGFVGSHLNSLEHVFWKPDRHGIFTAPGGYTTLAPSRRFHVPESWFTILPPSRVPGHEPYCWLVPPSPSVRRK